MYNNSEEDLFPGNEWINEEMANKMAEVMPAYTYNGFDPLKAQFRRAEIYKRALENFVKDHNNWITSGFTPRYVCDEYELQLYIEEAKEDIDNG